MDNEKSGGSKDAPQVTVTELGTAEEEKTNWQPDLILPVPPNPKPTATSSIDSSVPSVVSIPNEKNVELQTSGIPPTDKGWAAWRVLCIVILTQGVLFAFPLTFGVFQEYFGKHERLANSAHSIWIGVLSTGVPFMGAPFMTALCETRSPVHWRYYVLLGWAICTLSLIGAAFAKRLLVLGITQGVLYGIGLMILDVPALLILNTWFDKRRGLAYGLLFGTTDLLGFIATIIAGHLLRNHNLKRTLLTFAGILLVMSGPCMWFLRFRPGTIPVTEIHPPVAESGSEQLTEDTDKQHDSSDVQPRVTVRYYRRPTFYIFAFANLFHALAWYLPFLYLPTYATGLGLTSKRGDWLLAGANFAQIFGEIAFGQLSDGFNIHVLVLLCTSISSISALSLWGLARSFTALAFFALTFGAFGSGLIALWARMGTYFDQKDALMIFSVMSFGRGFASILSGPISSALEIAAASYKGSAKDGPWKYGNGKYFGIILFTGISMGMSAIMAIVGLIGTWHRKKENSREDHHIT